MKICVIGQGYIGIPTGMILAKKGFEVVGYDKDNKKIELLSHGKLPFHEAEFTKFSEEIFNRGNFHVSNKIEPADVYIICVPTPFTPNKKCDFKYIDLALIDIKTVIKNGDLVILESTVPPSTCKDHLVPILEEDGSKVGEDFFVSHAPERLLPGDILNEIINNDRIIGGLSQKSTEKTYQIYKKFCKGKILLTDATTAEMTKCIENTFRDVNIALANELTKICENLNINPYNVIELANHHPRVNILHPGPGVGGHCIPIDPWFIVEKDPVNAKLISQARRINDNMPDYVVSKVETLVCGIDRPKIAILGVSYKPNVDDPRESPSLKIIRRGEAKGWRFTTYDPLIKRFLSDFETVFLDANCIIYAVNHNVFYDMDLSKIAKRVKHKKIFICGDFGNQKAWKKEGFKVSVLGLQGFI